MTILLEESIFGDKDITMLKKEMSKLTKKYNEKCQNVEDQLTPLNKSRQTPNHSGQFSDILYEDDWPGTPTNKSRNGGSPFHDECE